MSRLVCPAVPDLDIPALYVHDLTGTAAAERLLPKTPHIHPSADLVLPRLRAWAPKVAALFTPVKTRTRDIPFRLITRHPVWNDNLVPGFVAVSYCWHSDDWQLAPLLQQRGSTSGLKLPISELMLSGVVRHLPTPDTGIWIDQLCIEQTNATEKKHAIEQMDTIYRNASRTIILVEDLVLTEPSENALFVLRYGKLDQRYLQIIRRFIQEVPLHCPILNLTDFGNDSELDLERLTHADQRALTQYIDAFFNSRWFNRAWCRQELLLSSPDMLILHASSQGILSIRQTFFLQLQMLAPRLADTSLLSTTFQNPRSSDYLRSLFLINHLQLDNNVVSPSQVFSDFRWLSCSIAADKIAIAMNIVGLPFGFDMNANGMPTTVEYVLSTLALAMGDGAVLGTGSSHFRSQDISSQYRVWHTQRGSPGSAINWQAHCESQFSLDSPSSIAENHLLDSVGEQSLVLGLLSFRCRPRLIPCKYLLHVFQYCNELRSIGSSSSALPSNLLEAKRLEPLIDNHLDHVDDSCNRYKNLPLSYSCMALIAMINTNWSSNISEGLDYKNLVHTDNVDQAATLAMRTWVDVAEHVSGLHSLRASMIQHLRFCFYPYRYLPVPIADIPDWSVTTLRIGNGEADIALLFLPKHIDLNVLNSSSEVSIAIPAALNTSDCVKSQRVWLLRNTEDSRTKSCFAKGYLFGRGSIAESDGCVDYIGGVKVVGPPLTDDIAIAAATRVDVQTVL